MLNTAKRCVEAVAAIMDDSLLYAYISNLQRLECLLKSALYNSEAFIIEISLWARMIKEGLDSDGK